MNYQRRWWAPVVAAAAGWVVLLAGCSSSGSNSAGATISPASGHGLAGFAGTDSPSQQPTSMPSTTPSSMPGMPSSAPASQAAAAPVASNSVTIHNFAFGPQVVTVKVGTTVHWTNHDTEAHTVTSNTGAFGSSVLQPGHGYSFTFSKPGTYSYHCTIHPFMTGKVVVS